MHGLNTLEHQPAKLAAMEGHWETNHDEGMPLYLFGIPDMQAEETKYAIGIPKLGSLILTHSMDGKVTGLKDFAPEDRPNSLVVFWSFRIMVGMGMLMLLLALWGLWSRTRGRFMSHVDCIVLHSSWVHPDFLPCWQDGLPQKSAVSLGLSTALCGPKMHYHQCPLNRSV